MILKNETQLKIQHELENAQKQIAKLQHEITKLNDDDILNIPTSDTNPDVNLCYLPSTSMPTLIGAINPAFFPIKQLINKQIK